MPTYLPNDIRARYSDHRGLLHVLLAPLSPLLQQDEASVAARQLQMLRYGANGLQHLLQFAHVLLRKPSHILLSHAAPLPTAVHGQCQLWIACALPPNPNRVG